MFFFGPPNFDAKDIPDLTGKVTISIAGIDEF
jgi:NAD(P)-dependent dehydrogenase (short-subunit alcohol dehydrogenase family)